MNATLASHTVCYVSLAVVLVVVGTPAPADVITTGDVDPVNRGAADPWAAGDKLYVGQSGLGTLTVQAGGVVTWATIPAQQEKQRSPARVPSGTAPKDCMWVSRVPVVLASKQAGWLPRLRFRCNRRSNGHRHGFSVGQLRQAARRSFWFRHA